MPKVGKVGTTTALPKARAEPQAKRVQGNAIRRLSQEVLQQLVAQRVSAGWLKDKVVSPERGDRIAVFTPCRMVSFAPAGAGYVKPSVPRAGALGYILSRLRRYAGGEKCRLGLLRQIASDIGLTMEEFLEHR